jgi:SAM-dependent methyltransferase
MTNSFYDELAPYFHLLYADWEAAILSQGAAIASLLREFGHRPGDPVLDAACGIGTQTLGLAMHGFEVTACDISPGELARLRSELSGRSLRAQVHLDDLRTLRNVAPASMAAIIACDNSIPHLLSDAEILQCFRSCYRSLRPQGIVLLSVRDYAAIERKSPDVRPYGMRHLDGDRFLAVQVWEWDEDHYDLRLYLTREFADGRCETKILCSRYYAVSIARLSELLLEAGFVDVQRKDHVLHQPVLVGRRAADRSGRAQRIGAS